MKILLVDDSKTAISMTKTILVKENHLIECTYNGQEAIDLLKKMPDFDLILLDWQMPVLDGPGFLKALSDNRFTYSAIVVLTAESNPTKVMELLKVGVPLGVLDYILKPFTKDMLLDRIKKLLTRIERQKAMYSKQIQALVEACANSNANTNTNASTDTEIKEIKEIKETKDTNIKN
ncbi:MAG: response regulator transcription factor [Oligoflexia bacterium]|nr:response regulator transcription factor [Oligoflexia bacterium]